MYTYARLHTYAKITLETKEVYTYARVHTYTRLHTYTRVYTYASQDLEYFQQKNRCIRLPDVYVYKITYRREDGPRPYVGEYTYIYRNLSTHFLLSPNGAYVFYPYSVALGPYILRTHHHQLRSFNRRQETRRNGRLIYPQKSRVQGLRRPTM